MPVGESQHALLRHAPDSRITAFPSRLIALLALAIVTVSLVFFLIQRQRLIDDMKAELAYVAEVKVRALTDGIMAQQDNAYVLSHNQIVSETVARWLESGAPAGATSDKIQQHLAELITGHHYDGVVLLDQNGAPKLTAGSNTALDAANRKNAEEAFRSGRIAVSDFEAAQDASERPGWFDLYVPLLAADKERRTSVALVLLRIASNKFIDPKILTWPKPSASAEALLARREGDNVVFFTALRYRPDAPLNLKMPLNDRNLLTALAKQGKEGEVEGVDYRGVPVVTALRKIPNFSWYLVAKIDVAEAYAPIRNLALVCVVIAMLAFLGVSGTVLFWWRARRSQIIAHDAQAEAERLALVKHFDYLTKYANDAITLADEHGNFVEVNDRAVSESGYTRDELLRMNGRDVVVPGAMTGFERLPPSAEAAGSIFQTIIKRKDGSTYPVEISARIIDIEGRRLYQNIVRDITERKQAEQALEESEAGLRSIFEGVLDGILVADVMTNKIVAANPEICRMLGYTSQEIVHMGVSDIHPKQDLSGAVEEFEKQLRGESQLSADVPVMRKDGSVFYADIKASRIRVGGKNCLLGVFRDITKRKLAEEALARESHRS